jgi:hypothetical protein
MPTLLGDIEQVASRTPMPVHDVTSSTKTVPITGERITFADGVAGTSQKIKLAFDGIMSYARGRIGMKGDTSLSFTTGTVFTNEVPWRFKDGSGDDTDTARLATLGNGEYMVDYENSYILGKNAITTASATDIVSYYVRLQGQAPISASKYDNAEWTTGTLTNYDVATPNQTLFVNCLRPNKVVIRADGAITVKFNSTSNPAITVAANTAFELDISFTSLYITTTGATAVKILMLEA